MNYLFKNFMKNEEVLQQNVAFFSDLISEISENELPEYYNIKFSKSEEEHEGCPILIAKYNWRTLKIIQRQAQSNRPIIFANLEAPKQLTIEMELSKEVLPTLKFYIRMWLVESISKQGINTVIEYNSTLKNNFSEKGKLEEAKSFQLIEKNNFGKLEEQEAFSAQPVESVFE